jgi:hypothetical protein
MSNPSDRNTYLVNSEITVPTVQVEVRWGPNLGIMSTKKALAEARRRGLDLVLDAALANPPSCEIMNMNRYIYNDELEIESKKAHPAPIEPMAGLPIPRKAKLFLARGGLPDEFVEFRINYDRAGLVRLDTYVEWWRQIEKVAFANTCRRLERRSRMSRDYVKPNPVDLSRYYRLGDADDWWALCIECESGSVVSIDIKGFKGYSPLTFINTDVVLFAKFISMYMGAQENERTRLRSRLKTLDRAAMRDQEGFWSHLVEEFELGMV